MSKIGRVKNILTGLLLIIIGVLLPLDPKTGIRIVSFILCLSLLLVGLRYLIYYFNMARYMVGGKSMLILGIILLDFSVLTLSISTVPAPYIMLYLLGIHAFSGGVDILRAFEAKRFEGRGWRLKMITGIINILMAVVAMICGMVTGSSEYAVLVYCIGLVYSGAVRIITAFRKTTIVYIS